MTRIDTMSKFLSFLQQNPRFPMTLPMVIMTLMTTGTQLELLYFLMSNVKFSHRQRRELIFCAMQMRVFIKLARMNARQLHLPTFKHFRTRVCLHMLDSCACAIGWWKGETIWYATKDNSFRWHGNDMPSLGSLREHISISSSHFFQYLEMTEDELQISKVKIFLSDMTALLNKDYKKHISCPEKFFRTWKRMVYVGDKSGKPLDDEYSRYEEDVFFLLLVFLASDAAFMKDFIETGKLLETHLISEKDTATMRLILYTECKSSTGLGESKRLVREPCTIFYYISFFSSRIYKNTAWDSSSYWHVLLKTSSRPSLVCRKPLGHEDRFEQFCQCFLRFLENLPDLI